MCSPLRPISSLNPSRPGFGPALKRLGRTVPARCHVGCRPRVAVQQYARQLPCRTLSTRGPWPRRLAIEPLARPMSRPRSEATQSTPRLRRGIVLGMAVSDTTNRVAALQLQLYREAGPSRRAQVAVDLSDAVRETALAGIRRRHPDYTDDQVKSAFLRIVYGFGNPD